MLRMSRREAETALSLTNGSDPKMSSHMPLLRARIRLDRSKETRLSALAQHSLSRLLGNLSPKRTGPSRHPSREFKETAMSTPSIVGISGSLSDPSRTSVLVKHVLRGLERETGYKSTFLELSQSAASLFAVRSPYDVNEARALSSIRLSGPICSSSARRSIARLTRAPSSISSILSTTSAFPTSPWC